MFVKPKLSTLTTAESLSGKAVLVRDETLTLAGHNFDPTAANNSVTFTLSDTSTVNATPSAATATQLTVTVPAGVNIAGDVGVKVTTHGQTSNSLTGTVPTLSLDITGGGFH